jgi:hypothetical protein
MNRRHDQHKSGKQIFENVVKFKHWGMSAAIQSRIFSHCIFKNIKIKIYGNIILPIAVYGYEIWSPHRLRLFENVDMKKIFGPKREEVM